MKHSLLVLSVLLFSTLFSIAQVNMTLVSNLSYPELEGNDIWGYVAPDGTEYALMGLENGVSVVSLADPANPVEVAFADGPNSIWRDTKTWGQYAYSTNETGQGILVMDLSMLPDSMSYDYWVPETGVLGFLSSCHNLYIDEFGYAYLVGCNINNGGPLFVDVFSDPGNPIYLGAGSPTYSHDIYVRDNKLYSSEIYLGQFSVSDVTDKSNPRLLATQKTPFFFTHHAWLSDDSNTLFTTDERGNASTAAYDLSDLSNIRLLDEFRPTKTLEKDVIPHNVHVLNDYLIISHYTDGIIIVDATHPDNLIEVGNYDTFDGADGGFNGCWGAYPFLPSGLILGSDIQSGLFVFEPNYTRACYLEGIVTDAATGETLFDVEVTIGGTEEKIRTTNLLGQYKTGQVQAGRFPVTFTKFGYLPQTVEVDLQNGELTNLNVELETSPRFGIAGQTVTYDGLTAPNVSIVLNSEELTYEIQSDANGMFRLDNIIENEYTLYIGGWGYHLTQMTIDETLAGEDLIFQVEQGYRDEFEIDLGWTTTSSADTELWHRAIPTAITSNPLLSSLNEDVAFDLGEQSYFFRSFDIEGRFISTKRGYGTLTSPPMDLSDYQNPILSYYRWFYNASFDGSLPDDWFEVRLSNGIEEMVLEMVFTLDTTWQKSEFVLKDLDIDLTDDMRILFETADTLEFSVVEAGIDYFEVVDEILDPVDETVLAAAKMSIAPNPFSEAIQVVVQLPEQLRTADLKLYNLLGELVHTSPISTTQTISLGEALSEGIYFLVLETEGKRIATQKLVKQ